MTHLMPNEIVEYADGSLSETARNEVEHHLTGCAKCRAELTIQQQIVVAARRSHLNVTVSPALRIRIMDAVLPVTGRSFWNPLVNNLGNVFAMMLVLGILGYFLNVSSSSAQKDSASLTFLDQAVSKSFESFSLFITTLTARYLPKTEQMTGPSLPTIFAGVVLSLILLFVADRMFSRQIRHKIR